jgi:hypothetical protein
MSISFTKPEYLWAGGFWELAVQLGPRSDERLRKAAEAIWAYPLIEGCYMDRDIDPEGQQRLSLSEAALTQLQSGFHIYGVAHFPDNLRLVCGSISIREDESGIDWLDFYIPQGAVEATDELPMYDFTTGNYWPQTHQILETWLAELGRYLFAHVPFKLGLVGHEASGEDYAENIVRNGIPASRYYGYLWPEEHGLAFYPSTK